MRRVLDHEGTVMMMKFEVYFIHMKRATLLPDRFHKITDFGRGHDNTEGLFRTFLAVISPEQRKRKSTKVIGSHSLLGFHDLF